MRGYMIIVTVLSLFGMCFVSAEYKDVKLEEKRYGKGIVKLLQKLTSFIHPENRLQNYEL